MLGETGFYPREMGGEGQRAEEVAPDVGLQAPSSGFRGEQLWRGCKLLGEPVSAEGTVLIRMGDKGGRTRLEAEKGARRNSTGSQK